MKDPVKPTIESLGLNATITPNGVRSMNEGEHPMCAWICTFTNFKTRRSENFNYFTGSGCGNKYPRSFVESKYGMADVKNILSGRVVDKSIACRLAHEWNAKTKWTPDPVEVLWAIAHDGDALESTFEDWAFGLGYDSDSRQAEKIYRASQDNALRLRRILSADKIQLLKEVEL